MLQKLFHSVTRLLWLIPVVVNVLVAEAEMLTPPPEDSAYASVSISGQLADILRESDASHELRVGGKSVSLSGTLRTGSGTWGFEAGRTQYEFLSRDISEDLDIRLRQAVTVLGCTFYRTFGVVGIGLGCTVLSTTTSTVPSFGATMSVRQGGHTAWSVHTGVTTNPFPASVRVQYSGAELSFPCVIGGLSASAGGSVGWDGTLMIEAEYERALGNPYRMESVYAYSDSLTSDRIEVFIQSRAVSLPASLRYRYASLKNSPELKTDGLTFSQSLLTGVEFHAVDFLFDPLPITGLPISAMLGYLGGRGKLVGNIQSWPFLSILESVIENRVNYRMTGRIDVLYAGLGYEAAWEGLRIRPSVWMYDVRPELSIETWQPVFLTIGFRDYSSSELDIRRMTMSRVQIACDIVLGFGTLTLSADQVFPLHIAGIETEAGGGTGEPARTSRTGSDGGRWFELTLTREFR